VDSIDAFPAATRVNVWISCPAHKVGRSTGTSTRTERALRVTSPAGARCSPTSSLPGGRHCRRAGAGAGEWRQRGPADPAGASGDQNRLAVSSAGV